MRHLLPYEMYYENTAGEKLWLSQVPFVATGGQLFDSKWTMTTAKRPLGEGIRLLRAKHSHDERTMIVRVAAHDAVHLSELLTHMSEIFDLDTTSLKPGKLWINGQYMKCWCSARQKELSCDFIASATVTVSILPETPVWCREYHYILMADADAETPKQKDYFYTVGTDTMTVKNSASQRAPMKIVFDGPCENPSVYINGEQIGMMASAAEGEQAVIDQQERSVYTISAEGEKTNCFNSRIKNGMTFSYLASGESTVVCTSTGKVEIIVVEQRSEPEWTLS